MKRGVFFSLDATIAIMVILIVILIAVPIINIEKYQTPLTRDVLTALSTLKVSEIQDAYIQSLVVQEIIDGNKTVLEQAGILSITNDTIATDMITIALAELDTKENIGIWYGNKLIYSSNSTPFENASRVDTERYIVSGLGGLNGTGFVSGYSARAFLSSDLKTKYFYFGGYIGDGNISALVESYGETSSAQMELAISNNFSLYINGIDAGSYQSSPSQTTPSTYDLDNYIQYFQPGNNTVEIKGANISIAGGFIKVTYESNDTYELTKRNYFPGIDGLINIYDGIYFPSNVSSVNIVLDLDSNYTTFLNIGNTTIYNGSTAGRQLIHLNDAYITSKINYHLLQNKTVPLRIGLENASFIPVPQVDVISVTDLSGSMSGQKITDAKTANNLLVDIILNGTKSRVGLAGFESYSKRLDFHNLSNISSSLKSTVNSQWNANGNTCICCGILKAISCIDNSTFADNFNGQTIGSNPTGWFVFDTASSPLSISSDSLEGDRAVKVARGLSTPYAYHRFNPQQDNLSIEFLVNNSVEAGNNSVRVEIEAVDSGGSSYNDYIVLKLNDSQIHNSNTPVTSYSLNQKYKIRISIVPGSSTYSLYVDDVLISSSLATASTSDNVASIRFTTEGSNSYRLNYTFDDVKVYLNQRLCEGTNRSRAMIVMSDGEANRACGMDPVPNHDGDGDTTDDPQDHAIEAACIAHNNYNFTVHGIAFDITSGSLADTTMQEIAQCGGGNYYSSNLTQLVQIYQDIGNLILATYAEQTLTSLVTGVNTKLYPTSFIEFNYPQSINPFGLIVAVENAFSNTTTANFSVPASSTLLETKVTSYSGSKWTHRVRSNNNPVYDITNYGSSFIALGDPYAIGIPTSLVTTTDNNITLSTAVSSTNISAGSSFNKIIYTVAKNFSSFSNILAVAQGCNWQITFDDGASINVTSPSNYAGANQCYFPPPIGSNTHDPNDAFQTAVYNLLTQLDLNGNGLVDPKFTEQALQIDLSQVTGIPFTWYTEVQIRVWS